MLPHLLPICHSVMGFLFWTRGVFCGSWYRKICILLYSDVIYSMYLGKVCNTILDPSKSPRDYSPVSLLLPLFFSQFLPLFQAFTKTWLNLLLLSWMSAASPLGEESFSGSSAQSFPRHQSFAMNSWSSPSLLGLLWGSYPSRSSYLFFPGKPPLDLTSPFPTRKLNVWSTRLISLFNFLLQPLCSFYAQSFSLLLLLPSSIFSQTRSMTP